MKMQAKMEFILYDTASIWLPGVPGDTYSSFGTSGEDAGETRVVSPHEAVLSNWIAESALARGLLLKQLGLAEDASCKDGVVEPVVHNRKKIPGDIDLLIAPVGCPQHTVAIECKRVPVISTDRKDRLLRHWVKSVRKGVRQANGLHAMGFHRSFLALVIVADTLAKPSQNLSIHPGTFSRIYDLPALEGLHEKVGLLVIEIVQPSHRSFEDRALVAIGVAKQAAGHDQPPTLSESIARLCEASGP
jgi:hypothetical protein